MGLCGFCGAGYWDRVFNLLSWLACWHNWQHCWRSAPGTLIWPWSQVAWVFRVALLSKQACGMKVWSEIGLKCVWRWTAFPYRVYFHGATPAKVNRILLEVWIIGHIFLVCSAMVSECLVWHWVIWIYIYIFFIYLILWRTLESVPFFRSVRWNLLVSNLGTSANRCYDVLWQK